MSRRLQILMGAVTAFLTACGEPPSSPPIHPPSEWKGTLIINAWMRVDADTIRPDSIEVFINQISNGVFSNPATLVLLEGDHEIFTEVNLNYVTNRSTPQIIPIIFNQISRMEAQLAPAGLTGSVFIFGLLNGTLINDSLTLWLDGTDLGRGANPWLLYNLSEGRHRATVWGANGTYQGWLPDLIVTAGDTSFQYCAFTPASIDSGEFAPDILNRDANDSMRLLSDERGKVVLLLFFGYEDEDCIYEELPAAQFEIAEAYPDSLVAVWGVNDDAPLDWFGPYREQFAITIPMLYGASRAFHSYRLGPDFGVAPPAYVVIDKAGKIRLMSIGAFSVSWTEIYNLIQTLLD